MSEATFDPQPLSLEELLATQEQITTAIRRQIEDAGKPAPEIPEVIRVSMHRYKARVTRCAEPGPRLIRRLGLAEGIKRVLQWLR